MLGSKSWKPALPFALARYIARSAFRDRRQQLIADLVAKAVVDDLEIVKIQEHDGDRPSVPVGTGERPLQSIQEEHPVRQTREGIVEGEPLQIALERLALRDVVEG